MNRNTVIIGTIATVAIVAFLAIVYMATGGSSTTNSNFSSDQVYPVTSKVLSSDHIKWSPEKKHILMEYGDLQCPGCQQAFLYQKANLDTDKTITDTITFIFRHFPLNQHKNSHLAAYAAEAAGKQDKFFEFIDLAYTNQKDWEESSSAQQYFEGLAQKLKLNIDTFKTDMNSDTVKKAVQSDISTGGDAQLSSTPTFYLDGKKVSIDTFDNFKKLLEDTAKGPPPSKKMVK